MGDQRGPREATEKGWRRSGARAKVRYTMAATRDDDTKENMPILYPIALPKNEKPKAQGGGGLSCMVGNCFAQTNGRRMTMTPSPYSKGRQEGKSASASEDDKENSNIAAALEGIRAMKEVLSRNNSAHELDVEVTSKAMKMRHNHVKPP